MIKMLRIDERLIHGQIVVDWSRYLGVNAIIVGNDMAATNSVVEMTLRMAAPTGIKVGIKTVRGAIDVLSRPQMEQYQVLVLASNPQDALQIVKQIPNIPRINLGNYGRLNREQQHRKTIRNSVYLNDEEISSLKEIIAMGIACDIQMVTSDPVIPLQECLEKRG